MFTKIFTLSKSKLKRKHFELILFTIEFTAAFAVQFRPVLFTKKFTQQQKLIRRSAPGVKMRLKAK